MRERERERERERKRGDRRLSGKGERHAELKERQSGREAEIEMVLV